ADRSGKYILVVRDTGVGFPEDLNFYRTKTLGMQLVTDLVSQLEGSIELRRSKGTEFRIVF
ncbi:MAG: ATP-binding protein, partial [Candidatus Aminicenantales bacterium]